MKPDNPFTITFGKEPNKQISRYEDIDNIISTFTSDNAVSQTFLIEGIRGSGKTVLMTTVAKKLEKEKDWVVINLNPAMDLLAGFALRLKEVCKGKTDALSKGFSISAAGFEIGINGTDGNIDYVGEIDKAFAILSKKKKRVLITIDEVIHDNNMKIFASQFQIFVRQDYPIFLIMTGLYENIYEIQNDPSLTFLLRSPKIVTGPLSILQISKQYEDIFGLNDSESNELAKITKGYAFAFQALGVSYWNNRKLGMKKILEEFEYLLDDFVYKKVWNSLTDKEKEIVLAISEDRVKVSEVCERARLNNSSFSKYREALIRKGVLESNGYGYVSIALPRFYEVVNNYGYSN